LFRVSVDVGGTFTDLVAFDEETGKVMNIKVPSVPRNPERGVTDAFSKFLEERDEVLIGSREVVVPGARHSAPAAAKSRVPPQSHEGETAVVGAGIPTPAVSGGLRRQQGAQSEECGAAKEGAHRGSGCQHHTAPRGGTPSSGVRLSIWNRASTAA